MAKTFYHWEQIKIEYEFGKALNAIRRDYGCNRATIHKHAAKDAWSWALTEVDPFVLIGINPSHAQ